jgi:glycosyltransferase involved in cell wall biosynthesis
MEESLINLTNKSIRPSRLPLIVVDRKPDPLLKIMRIAFITFSTVPFGSNDLLFYRATQHLLASGNTILVSVYDWHDKHPIEYVDLQKAGALVHRRSRGERPLKFFARQWAKLRHKLRNPTKSWKFLSDFQPDVIVVSDPATYHFTTAAGFLDHLMTQTTPLVTISQYNDENAALHPYTYQRSKIAFTRATTSVFVSSRNLEVARRQLCLPLSQAIVLDNPPNLTTWKLIPYPPTETLNFAIVARLEVGIKGQALVIDVLSNPEWRDRNWVLNLYGSGPDEAYLNDLIAFRGLTARVHLRGYAKNVADIWQENHLLILTSSGEGKPLALTEAMLCGRPAVVTDVAGNAELITEGITGFVAESATLSSIQSTLERAWEHRTQWSEMGRRAHDFIASRLTPTPDQRLASLIETLGSAQ